MRHNCFLHRSDDHISFGLLGFKKKKNHLLLFLSFVLAKQAQKQISLWLVDTSYLDISSLQISIFIFVMFPPTHLERYYGLEMRS